MIVLVRIPLPDVNVTILSSFVVLNECCTVFSIRLGVCSIFPSPIGILEIELSLGVYKYKLIPLPFDPPPSPAGPIGPVGPTAPSAPASPSGP
jgi:hypothetical protein